MTVHHQTSNTTITVVLHPASIEALADALAARLAGQHRDHVAPGLVSASTLAARLGRSPAWVRAHADQLGAIRDGTGPRPRLLFDPAKAVELLASCSPSRTSGRPESPARTAPRRPARSPSLGTKAGLLPVRPPKPAKRGQR